MKPEPIFLHCAHGVPMNSHCPSCASDRNPAWERIQQLERENARLQRHFELTSENALKAEKANEPLQAVVDALQRLDPSCLTHGDNCVAMVKVAVCNCGHDDLLAALAAVAVAELDHGRPQ